MNIKLILFANLKDYFPHQMKLNTIEFLDQFPNANLVLANQTITVSKVRSILSLMKPESTELLNNCRTACNNEFVDDDYLITESDELIFFPPSSGG